jgi:hypothetical protein
VWFILPAIINKSARECIMKRLAMAGLLVSTLGFGIFARAQFVDDTVSSDGTANTASGTEGLYLLTSAYEKEQRCQYTTTNGVVDANGNPCSLNSAFGADVLYQLTTGWGNSSFGALANTGDTTGSGNIAVGVQALAANQAGNDNTAIGFQALLYNTASSNTGTGFQALFANRSGIYNNADGYQALYSNQTGGYNTASGYEALTLSTGSYNSAFGAIALAANVSGSANTAVGNSALNANQGGGNNTATGSNALFMNDSGNTGASGNTANGAGAMNNNVTGNNNTAVGWQALQGTTSGASGSNNTGIGVNALLGYSTGSNNIAVGYEAALNVATGSNNIEIGNVGTAGDNKVIKIGQEGIQKKTIIAGIYSNTAVSGLAVVIGSNGELGAVSSSERFKTAIAPLGANTDKLQQLRPVTFRYKADSKGTLRYGLIAEEVATVYPELVVHDDKGRIDGVRYDELAPMLLNEMQHQRAQMTQKIDSQAAKIASLEKQLAGIQAALVKLQPKDQLVAQR